MAEEVTPTTSNNARPRDSPATSFETDPLLCQLIPYIDTIHRSSSVKKQNVEESIGSRFALILVTGWPFEKRDRCFLGKDSYNSFLDNVKKCFKAEDLVVNINPPHDRVQLPAVYLYPPECMHITIATLDVPTGSINESENTKKMELWQEILNQASRKRSWPKKPLDLRISSSQIGKNAGILLWDEQTGGLRGIRTSILEVVQEQSQLQIMNDIDLRIPNIIHSTFLRFAAIPKTDGNLVQTKFKEFVLPKLEANFSKPITLENATLVCERRPYMHIPNDENHTLRTFSFVGSNEEEP